VFRPALRADDVAVDHANAVLIEGGCFAQHRAHVPFSTERSGLGVTWPRLRTFGSKACAASSEHSANSGEGYSAGRFANAYLREVDVMQEPLEGGLARRLGRRPRSCGGHARARVRDLSDGGRTARRAGASARLQTSRTPARLAPRFSTARRSPGSATSRHRSNTRNEKSMGKECRRQRTQHLHKGTG